MDEKQAVFGRLAGLPPEHPYWKNEWRFTRPVFTSESRQMQDSAVFWIWASDLPLALRKYIDRAPCAE